MGKDTRRATYFNWDALHFNTCDLESLGQILAEKGVLAAIKFMPSDKAPSPDGFTGAFFKACWAIIKNDLMAVISLFSNLHAENIHWINSANVVLPPKKDGAKSITDYRPISFINAVTKIVAKMMVMRLAPLMNTLTSRAQSAFIKSRSTHDNFMFMRNYARRLQRTKTPSILLKLDIKRLLTPSSGISLGSYEKAWFPLVLLELGGGPLAHFFVSDSSQWSPRQTPFCTGEAFSKEILCRRSSFSFPLIHYSKSSMWQQQRVTVIGSKGVLPSSAPLSMRTMPPFFGPCQRGHGHAHFYRAKFW